MTPLNKHLCKIFRATRLQVAMAGLVISSVSFTACESRLVDLDAKYSPTSTVGQATDSKLFVDYEEQPSFPGGQEALLAFLDQNVRYPEEFEGCAQGRVVVSFDVDVDGSIVDPVVMRGIDPILDAEALRVVKLMPKWNPGKENGKCKRMKYTIPIRFQLK